MEPSRGSRCRHPPCVRRVHPGSPRTPDPAQGGRVSSAGRAWLRIERFVWFAFASAVAGVWVFFEAVTGKEIPSHAHPVLGALVVAALMFGGVDIAKVNRIRRELLAVAREAGADPQQLEAVAHRIAVLEVEDPELVQTLRALAPRMQRGARPKTDPQTQIGPPPRRPRRPPTQPEVDP